MHTNRRKPLFDPVADWDGLCGHPSGLRTPEQMEKIAQAKVDAMDQHPGLKWLRSEDEREHCPPRRQARMKWWK